MRKITFISSFFIKIFALIFMTFDHVGLFLQMQYSMNQSMVDLSNIFRTIGRLALPLFAFMIVEGVMHTKNFKKYILRLGIMASIVSTFFILLEYTPWFKNLQNIQRAGNIFLDLSLLAVAIYCLKHKNWKVKLITLLPLAFSALSFIVKGIETANKIEIHWFPAFITLQYDWFTILLGLGFYAAYLLADLYIKMLQPTYALDKQMWIDNGNYRLLVNIISTFIVALVSIIYYLFTFIWPKGVFWDAPTQLYAIFSGAFILLYSGKRGYNSKWFQYGSYLYYPIHIAIIGLIFILINGGL